MLTNLIPGLLDLANEGKIALRPAVSYLTETEQRDSLETIGYEDATASLAQAIKMRDFSKAGRYHLEAGVMENGFCSSGQSFAAVFLLIPSHDERP